MSQNITFFNKRSSFSSGCFDMLEAALAAVFTVRPVKARFHRDIRYIKIIVIHDKDRSICQINIKSYI